MRNEVIEHKRKQPSQNVNKTYSQTLNTNNTPAQQPLDKDTCAKITPCMLQPHMLNAINPETHKEEFNRAFSLNNLPKINLPSNSLSKQIFIMITNSSNSEAHAQQQQ